MHFAASLACSLERIAPGRRCALLAVAVAIIALASTFAADAGAESLQVKPAKPMAGGPLSSAQRRLLDQGYLVPDQAAYEQARARAARRAPGSLAAGDAAFSVRAPTANPSFAGIRDTNVGPPDTTGAVGKTRFIETINDRFAIYDKTSTTPISTGTLNSLWGTGSVFTTDPQVIWDPGTKRFYYAGLVLVSSTDNRLTFGFSKTASPNSAADFCNYTVSYGTELPDYPKLGDTRDFGVIGVNTFSNSSPSGSYVGSDVVGVTKPPSGTTCPALAANGRFGIKNANGTPAFTPVPANQTDTSATGYVAAVDGNSPSTKLSLFKVSKNTDGSAKIAAKGKTVTVPSYSVPPSAPQSGTSSTLDTLDGRLTQAVSAIDPARWHGRPMDPAHGLRGRRLRGPLVRDRPGRRHRVPIREGDERVALRVQRRDLAEPDSQRCHQVVWQRHGDELRPNLLERPSLDRDGLEDRSGRAVVAGPGEELALLAERLHVQPVPLGRLRRRHAGSGAAGGHLPSVDGQRVGGRARLRVRVRLGHLELRDHAVVALPRVGAEVRRPPPGGPER